MKIDKIKGYVLSSPYGNGKVFGQPKGVKSIAVVEIHSGDFVGYGESYVGIYAPELFESTVKFLSDRIIGKEIVPYYKIIDELKIPFVGYSGFVNSVIGAIDVALHDILSQSIKEPLYKTLGKEKPNKVEIYASGGSVVYSKEEIKDEVEFIKEFGINHYKLRCGYRGIVEDIERIETAVKTLNNDNVMVDYIQGTLNNLSRDEIMYNLSALNEFNLFWIEELCHPYDIEILYDINKKTKNPLAFGEHYTNHLEFLNVLPYVDFIQPDVTQCGGYTGLDRIMEFSENTLLAMHCWGSSISFNANLHAALAYGAIMEYSVVSLEINQYINKNNPEIVDGVVKVPTEPGLGIYISDEIKEKYKFVKGSGYKL